MSELSKLAEMLRKKHPMNTPAGGMQYVIDVALVRLASDIEDVLREEELTQTNVGVRDFEHIGALADQKKPGPGDKVQVEHFKESGKYYVTDEWRIPEDAVGPWDMKNSPDFRDLGMTIVVPTQEPWGFPHILKTVPMPEYPRG